MLPKVTFTNVYFDHKNLKIKVELANGGDDPVVETPEALYIIGDVNGWDTATGIAMTKNGDKFTAEGVRFVVSGENTVSFFNLSDKLAADWDALNAIANRYGAAAEGEELIANMSSEFVVYKNNVDASGCLSWAVTPGNYDVEVDFATGYITLTQSSAGVDAIEIDSNNGAVEYFNLQGVRVAEPTAGLYIVRRGDKVAKEIVR